MLCEMKTTKQILNEAGRISDSHGLAVDVRFDLIETQDCIGGFAVRRFSYGNLRFDNGPNLHVKKILADEPRLYLTGGGIRVTVRLLGTRAFTVMSDLAEASQ